MGVKIGQLGSLKEELLKFTPKRDSKDLTKAQRIQTDKDGILQRIGLIEQGREAEARWLADINQFVARMEKMAGIKIVGEDTHCPKCKAEYVDVDGQKMCECNDKQS